MDCCLRAGPPCSLLQEVQGEEACKGKHSFKKTWKLQGCKQEFTCKRMNPIFIFYSVGLNMLQFQYIEDTENTRGLMAAILSFFPLVSKVLKLITMYFLLDFLFVFSLSSRELSIWCLRRHGGLRICSALWFSSVSNRRMRKRRAGLCPACLIGCWRPCRTDLLTYTTNKNSHAHSFTNMFSPSCHHHTKHLLLQAERTNAISILENLIHVDLSMEVVFLVRSQP